LNEAYHKAVDYQYSSIPTHYTRSGFQVPIDVKFEPYVGRGVFATTLIKRGTLVYRYINVAEFKSGRDYRNFIQLLPPGLACDVLNWAYPFRGKADDADDNEEGDTVDVYRICVELDEASLINTSTEGRDFEVNVSEVDGDGDDDEEEDEIPIPTVSIRNHQNCPKKEFLCAQGKGIFANRDILPGEGEFSSDKYFVSFLEYASNQLPTPSPPIPPKEFRQSYEGMFRAQAIASFIQRTLSLIHEIVYLPPQLHLIPTKISLHMKVGKF
jgi:hypothetical protein